MEKLRQADKEKQGLQAHTFPEQELKKDKITKTLYSLAIYLRSQTYTFKIFDVLEITRIRILTIAGSLIILIVTLRNFAFGVERGQYGLVFNR